VTDQSGTRLTTGLTRVRLAVSSFQVLRVRNLEFYAGCGRTKFEVHFGLAVRLEEGCAYRGLCFLWTLRRLYFGTVGKACVWPGCTAVGLDRVAGDGNCTGGGVGYGWRGR